MQSGVFLEESFFLIFWLLLHDQLVNIHFLVRVTVLLLSFCLWDFNRGVVVAIVVIILLSYIEHLLHALITVINISASTITTAILLVGLWVFGLN
jgi:hypothetical protein